LLEIFETETFNDEAAKVEPPMIKLEKFRNAPIG